MSQYHEYTLNDWMRAMVYVEHPDGRLEATRFGAGGLGRIIENLKKGYTFEGILQQDSRPGESA